MSRPLVLVALLSMTGCNSILGIPQATLASDGAGADACTMNCPVTGSSQLRVLDGANPTGMLVGSSLASIPIVALEVAADGSITDQQPGTGDTSGHFTIPGVPFGEYYLQDGVDIYYVTSAREFDQIQPVLGRQDATNAGTETLTFDVSKMSTSWQPGDNLQIFCDNNAAYAYEIGGAGGNDFTPTLPTGALGLANTIAWGNEFGANLGQPVISAGEGDVLEVWHASSSALMPGVTAAVLAEYFSTSTLEMGSGSNTVNGGFSSLVATEHAAFTWAGSAWHATSPWPIGTTNASMTITDLPYTTAFGQPSYTADLATLVIDPTVVTGDTPMTVTYGNPETAAQEVGLGAYSNQELVSIDGGDPSLPSQAQQSVEFSIWPIAQVTGSIAPLVSSPQDISIASGGATQSLMTANAYNVSPTGVTISWTPPALGTPTSYQVEIFIASLRPARSTTTNRLAVFTTPHTSLVVPNGFLVANKTYLVEVIAHVNDLDAPPPLGHAEVFTRTFRTGPAPTACGTSGAACCTTIDGVDVSGSPCNAGLGCVLATNTCEACGGSGGPCCLQFYAISTCTSSTQNCMYADDAHGTCVACGGTGQPACQLNVCNANGCDDNGGCEPVGAVCVNSGSGTGTCGAVHSQGCGACGAIGDPCCGGAGGNCTASDSICDPGGANTCVACGHSGQPCCSDGCAGETCDGNGMCD